MKPCVVWVRTLTVGVCCWAACSGATPSEPSGGSGGGSGTAGNGVTNSGASGGGASLPACAACTVLPIEVLGPGGTMAVATFDLPSGSHPAVSLFMQIHGLAFQNMGSVQLNDQAWVPLSNATVRIPEHQARYGGIGGAFATLKITMPLSADATKVGPNVIRFRFEKTDGRTMGFRVVRFNLLDAAGGKLLDEGTHFRDDDVAAWRAPSDRPEDIAAGETLWRTAELVRSPLDSAPIKATCSDCHAQDARDLKYFNYSNHSIIERAKFHGLTDAQGENIASYVRSNPSIAPGRPWNPPYQPGPGLTQQPVAAWSAGAGIDAVLDDEASGFQALPAGGKDPAALMDGKYIKGFDVHDLPLPLQFLDWNHWLPAIHPKDSLGDAFEPLDNFTVYQTIRLNLEGRGAAGQTRDDYVADGLLDDLMKWANSLIYTNGNSKSLYDTAMPTATVSKDQFLAAYFGGTWNATKLWEIMHEFDLEGLGPQVFGLNGDDRSWMVNRHVFDVSPHIIHQIRIDQTFLENVNTHGDCAPILMNAYLANTWYALQMQLNSGNRLEAYGGHHTVDWGYTAGLFGDLHRATMKSEPLRRTIFTLKSFEVHDSSTGPEQPNGPWWSFNLRDSSITSLALEEDWSDVPDRDAYVQTVLQVWAEKAGEFTVEQWLSTAGYDGSNFDPPSWIIGSGTGDQNDRSQATGIYNTLLNAQKSFKIHGAVLGAIANFGKALWPNNNWDQFHPSPPAPIAAPAPLSVQAGVEQANITWMPIAGAASYNVWRATTTGGPYLTVALRRPDTHFTDTDLDPSITYRYRVTANVGDFEGDPSVEAPVKPLTGLVGHWTFDDQDPRAAADSSTSRNTGQLFGMATRVAGPGRYMSVLLDGKTGFISLRRSLHHWLGASATLAAWMKTSAPGGSIYFQNPGLAGRAGGGVDEIYWGTMDSKGRIGMAVGGGDDKRIQTPNPVNDNQWHHVAMSRDVASGAIKLYLDGKLVAIGAGEQRPYLARFFALGRTAFTPNYLGAALADVRVYDKALADDEVAALAVIP